MSFRHEAMLYAGEDEFVEHTAAFVRDGVEADEAVLVVVGARKIDLLRERLDGAAADVLFADMADVGANPARIIPAWREFVLTRNESKGLRGVGEPVFPERSAAELVECQRHESLLNLAFADVDDFWLLCPYDVEALPAETIDEAWRSHPHVTADSGRESVSFRGLEEIAAPFEAPLPEPPVDVESVPFDLAGLGEVRGFVRAQAVDAGLGQAEVDDLVLAVNEVATNSVRHGAGNGAVRVWQEHGAVVCEVTDRGSIANPLAGRVRPLVGAEGGHGLWLANHVCDLVQIRSLDEGTTVRLHLSIPQR